MNRSQENYEQRLLMLREAPILKQGIYGSYRHLWTQTVLGLLNDIFKSYRIQLRISQQLTPSQPRT